jgi:hypothetical protein
MPLGSAEVVKSNQNKRPFPDKPSLAAIKWTINLLICEKGKQGQPTFQQTTCRGRFLSEKVSKTALQKL